MNAISAIKFISVVPLLILLLACTAENTGSSAPSLPTVSAASVIYQSIPEMREFSGRLAASESVELRPRVSGHIDSVLFSDGQVVEEGTLLFIIDPKPFEASVQKLEAELGYANSQSDLAKSELERAKKLITKDAISREALDGAQAKYQQSLAQVKSVKSSLALAELDLSHTIVKAPISGRISNAFQTKGNYVSAGQSLLTEIVSTNEVYVYFDADEASYLELLKLNKTSGGFSNGAPVFMSLAGEPDFPHQGHIDFVDNKVNENAGTIKMRAVFANHDNLLVPGLFARVQVMKEAPTQAILINDKAIGTDLDQRFVLALDQDNLVQYRKVVPGRKVAGLRVIESGLSEGDQIVVNGLQRVSPGTKVIAEKVDMASRNLLEQLHSLQKRIDSFSQPSPVASKIHNNTLITSNAL